VGHKNTNICTSDSETAEDNFFCLGHYMLCPQKNNLTDFKDTVAPV
jgi:hypothetical protein